MWSAKPKTFTQQPFQKNFAYSWVRKGKVNCRWSHNKGPSHSYRELRSGIREQSSPELVQGDAVPQHQSLLRSWCGEQGLVEGVRMAASIILVFPNFPKGCLLFSSYSPLQCTVYDSTYYVISSLHASISYSAGTYAGAGIVSYFLLCF